MQALNEDLKEKAIAETSMLPRHDTGSKKSLFPPPGSKAGGVAGLKSPRASPFNTKTSGFLAKDYQVSSSGLGANQSPLNSL